MNKPKNLDLTAQIDELEISAYDDTSSYAPDSTINARRHVGFSMKIPAPKERPSFMGFGTSGKKSPLGRAAINRMT